MPCNAWSTLSDCDSSGDYGKKEHVWWSIWEGIWPCLDPKDCVRSRTAAMERNEPKKYEPYGELLFFLMQKEREPLPGERSVRPALEANFLWPFSEVVVSDFVLSFLADKGIK